MMRSVTCHHAWDSHLSLIPSSSCLTCCRSRAHLFGMLKDFPTSGWKHLLMGKGGLGSLVCDTMSMCSPSRGLTTGFQVSLQHLENNLRGHPRVGSNPRPRVSCLVLYPLGHCDEIKVHACTIPDISLSHRLAIIAD